jgi:hypothetical protein
MRLTALSVFLLAGFALTATAADDTTPARKADFTMTAEALAKAVLTDPAAGLTKYKGKIVTITGAVSGADPTYTGSGFHLNGGKKKPTDAFNMTVACQVGEDLKEKAWLLGLGQKVRVTGEVASTLGDSTLRLVDCTYKELEKSRIPTVSSKALATAYATNERAANVKYGDRYNRKEMFVEGMIKEIKDTDRGAKHVILEGTGAMKVVGVATVKVAEKLNVGDTVKLKTMCRGFFKENSGVLVDVYVVVPKK